MGRTGCKQNPRRLLALNKPAGAGEFFPIEDLWSINYIVVVVREPGVYELSPDVYFRK